MQRVKLQINVTRSSVVNELNLYAVIVKSSFSQFNMTSTVTANTSVSFFKNYDGTSSANGMSNCTDCVFNTTFVGAARDGNLLGSYTNFIRSYFTI